MAVESELKERYEKEVVPRLMERFKYNNPMNVPKVVKVVVNMGVGDSIANPKLMDAAVHDLAAITGQKPLITKAKKSIASFKVREGMPIGCKVTLRGQRMYDFMEKLFFMALPRVRDFRGVSTKGFDGRGSYTLGVREQIIFPEVEYDKTEKVRGMDVTLVTSANSDEEARELLALLGMPFTPQR
ncbi:MAG: 50S ribosomal protein L5 [Sulfobacillus thermosulfidooxidans]|uniref:Large ribosomal subunit protein uL5 n=1 Tax=Sulfobacillus thermotolerans TaxID=338644 RepID=A0ABM6RNN5_9FIRM|nr:50S ribosomal protein L5 [Sulfobacillus sp. hq2]AUW92950.1 50S ribosomal protein L5 [Sulfobacillus thermotolerans]MCY0907126.1 50S ribosomal protein L5 [Sulfobacillus thermotolerans]POB11187.1 50S ribosomal protein L5 [Sulfobacillus sp. hq2]PSR37228.1 MAG: 50S ribosomal protein L5 [Sulfobacillus thermosulfidooxidans]